MSFRLLHKTPKKTKDKIHEEWLDAMRDMEHNYKKLNIFFIKLYNLKESNPDYWNAVYTILKNNLAQENLDFFVENLLRTRNLSFTVKDWNEFYIEWIEPTDGFGSKINITAAELEALRKLNKEISLKEDDLVDFDKITIQTKISVPKTLNGNELLELISTKLLVLANKDYYSFISEALQHLDGASVEMREEKEKKEKKEMKERKGSKSHKEGKK